MVTRSIVPRQTEHEAGREVDQSLGVGVVHVGEVHDHRRALAEALADLLGLVVGARVDRRDPVERPLAQPGDGRAWWRTERALADAASVRVRRRHRSTGGRAVVAVAELAASSSRRTRRTRRTRVGPRPRRGRGRPSLYASRRPCLTALRSWRTIAVATVSPGRLVLRTLPERRPRTEQRAPDTQVCRAVRDGGLEIVAHPGRQRRSSGVRRRRARRPVRRAGRTPRRGSAPSGATRHDAAQPQVLGGRDRVGQGWQRRSARAPPTARVVAARRGRAAPGRRASRPASPAALSQGPDQRAAVDRVDHVGVRRHRVRLVGLQLPDEVPAKPGRRRRTRRPSGPPPGRGSPPRRAGPGRRAGDVGGGERLGHRDQAYASARRRPAGGSRPRRRAVRARPSALGSLRRAGSAAARPRSRSSARRGPPNRPVTPSRR